jgi:hypothetical protein
LTASQRYTIPQIREFLEKQHGVNVPRSTLYAYLRSLPEAQQPVPPEEPRVSPEEEHFFAQREVYEQITRMTQDMDTALCDVKARLGVLEDANAERHQAMTDALRGIGDNAASTPGPDPALTRIEQGLKELESRVAGLTIQVVDPTLKVRIWKRAALMTGAAWAVVCALAFLYFGPTLWHTDTTAAAPTAEATTLAPQEKPAAPKR